MTENDNPNIRDGTDQDSAGGDDNDPTEQELHKRFERLRVLKQAIFDRGAIGSTT